ncbi:hypothetical protein CVT24_011328 [Panaeolus cyanescens]|uniref:Alpha-ketoglutarate-dependent dioxygenase AlkB-like domain-containing protein n=1 Tax=Panaeolus cyanescens TaxID=181874 RepID=A0A409WDR0_9AGAR|nr:hypothetical protein CVT24_011328 [Panaeolus cyanescens]
MADGSQAIIHETLSYTANLIQVEDKPLKDEPWGSIKAGILASLRGRDRYKTLVDIARSNSDNMTFLHNWLAKSLGTLSPKGSPKGKARKSDVIIIDDADIHFCIEYFADLWRGDRDGAKRTHMRRLRELGYGFSVSAKGSALQAVKTESASASLVSIRRARLPNHSKGVSKGSISQPAAKPKRVKTKPASLSVYEETKPIIGSDIPQDEEPTPPAKKRKMRETHAPAVTIKTEDTSDSQLGQISKRQYFTRQAALSLPETKVGNGPVQVVKVRMTRSRSNAQLGVSAAKNTPVPSISSASSKKRKAEYVDKSSLSPSKRRKPSMKTEVEHLSVTSEPSISRRRILSNNAPSQPHSAPANVSSPKKKSRRTYKRKAKKTNPVTPVAIKLEDNSRLPSEAHLSECHAAFVPKNGVLPVEKSAEEGENTGQSLIPPPQLDSEVKLTSLPAIVPTTVDKEPINNGPTEKLTAMGSTSEGTVVVEASTASSDTAVNELIVSASPPTNSTDVPASTVKLLDERNVPCLDSIIGFSHMVTFDSVKTEEEPPSTLGVAPPNNTCLAGIHEVDMTKATTDGAFEPIMETPQFPRPPLLAYPPIWSQSRQELCESFDWFRSYQGGVYFTGGIVKGYLLSAFGAKRDFFKHEGKLIVSHGGGRAESIHSTKGNLATIAASDQLADDKSVRALRQNFLQNIPLALVIDDKYPFFPHELASRDVTYAVLGFYTISHMWAEYQDAKNEQGRVVRYKFAFRWCDSQGPPWWIMPSETDVPSSDVDRQPCSTEPEKVVNTCRDCGEESTQVYSLSWVCLNPSCKTFWRRGDGTFLPEQLSYHPGFLNLPPSSAVTVASDLEPAYPIPANVEEAKTIVATAPTSYPFTRGFHCSTCGRLSCRSKWEKWECMNCRHSLTIIGKVRQAKEFWGKTIISTSFRDNYVHKLSGITRLSVRQFSTENGHMGIVQTFVLPHDRGHIHHIQPKTPMDAVEADRIFEDYQKEAANGQLLFRRWPLRAHKCRGTLLTNYFSQNTGQPYQYVGGDANTVPFDAAPSAVLAARNLLQKRVAQALGKTNADFNEILSAAYMEKQKMAFHSDNEVGLGPLVAGLSMGAAAMMHFRLLSKHDPERLQRGIQLSFTLRHGDILVMDGAGVQKFYEHTVVPTNFRIAATARQITPAHH